MTRIVTLASPKGGSGKTMVCASLASALAGLGSRVLMIDADSATNGLTLLFLPEVSKARDNHPSEARGVFDPAIDDDSAATAIDVPGGLLLVPATMRFTNTEDLPQTHFRSSLVKTVAEYRDQVDYIFIDAQAGADPSAVFAMGRSIATEVVIVSEYDPMSAAGVERLKALLPDELSFDRTSVLLNKLLPEFIVHFREFLGVANYLSPLPWDADVVRAYSRRALPLDLDSGNDFTLSLMQTLRSLLGSDFEEQHQAWLADRGSQLRRPIETQHENLQAELQDLYELRVRLESRMQAVRRYPLFAGGVIVAIGATSWYTIEFFFEFSDLLKTVMASLMFIILVVVGIEYQRLARRGIRYEVDLAVLADRIDRQRQRLEQVAGLLASSPEQLIKQRSMIEPG